MRVTPADQTTAKRIEVADTTARMLREVGEQANELREAFEKISLYLETHNWQGDETDPQPLHKRLDYVYDELSRIEEWVRWELPRMRDAATGVVRESIAKQNG